MTAIWRWCRACAAHTEHDPNLTCQPCRHAALVAGYTAAATRTDRARARRAAAVDDHRTDLQVAADRAWADLHQALRAFAPPADVEALAAVHRAAVRAVTVDEHRGAA